MAGQPLRFLIQRMQDGRHAVASEDGKVFGLHKSLASANRQIADYLSDHDKQQVQKAGASGKPQSGAAGQRFGQQMTAGAQAQQQAEQEALAAAQAQQAAPQQHPGAYPTPNAQSVALHQMAMHQASPLHTLAAVASQLQPLQAQQSALQSRVQPEGGGGMTGWMNR